MIRLVLGTNNPGKLAELLRLLEGCEVEAQTPAGLGLEVRVDETGTTYAQNATLKARAFARAVGCLALGDDSGLEVKALGGRPGVQSARYGGPSLDDAGRVQRLLREMEGLPMAQRAARFVAVVAVATPGGEVRLFEGAVEGRIAMAPRGQTGFGYDPVFETPGGSTMAELPDPQKDAISHRGQAVRAALHWLSSRQA